MFPFFPSSEVVCVPHYWIFDLVLIMLKFVPVDKLSIFTLQRFYLQRSTFHYNCVYFIM